MLKKRLALPQPPSTQGNLQQPALVSANRTIADNGQRGAVAAGIDAQNGHHAFSVREMPPNTPLMKLPAFSVE